MCLWKSKFFLSNGVWTIEIDLFLNLYPFSEESFDRNFDFER
ncbi:hypothetical protein LEP1GSC137_1777 [Leptospira borgpetersenii str. Noumea 25]|uniref:Uncharacterized protein n=1 Tax=Leptospira borgpetersenii str. 200801926 TaxID=1193009 RepID=A0ABN0I2G0_LEPBO|nr:hypothetical protein LEP1GSC128_1960 [Leptospira borgpetersenii str. 200801926]EKQ93118.1 hypothetical protein LEP1GSC101_3866 [Leptospira borgpetersenii str. UI 09149]EMO07897.1 hypothetical protein LEP1GSC137_1777 [Leptospira borgpetersenii str. Noumea 25]